MERALKPALSRKRAAELLQVILLADFNRPKALEVISDKLGIKQHEAALFQDSNQMTQRDF